MDRLAYERLVADIESSPHTPGIIEILRQHGVKPDVPERTDEFCENVTMLGAQELPMGTRHQRLGFCEKWDWSDPEEIAYVAVAHTQPGKQTDCIARPSRTIIVLQNVESTTSIYVYCEDGTGWTVGPLSVQASY